MAQQNKAAALAQVGMPQQVTFHDKAFKSRTVVFADGTTAPVVKSLITVLTAERVDQLDQLDDFERAAAGA